MVGMISIKAKHDHERPDDTPLNAKAKVAPIDRSRAGKGPWDIYMTFADCKGYSDYAQSMPVNDVNGDQRILFIEAVKLTEPPPSAGVSGASASVIDKSYRERTTVYLVIDLLSADSRPSRSGR